MPPRRKAAAAAEAAEPTDSSEARVERASRSRRAPVRFQSSQNPTSRRGAKRQRLAASPTETLEERVQACKREVKYVANYTYDHIGQAVQDADPPVWVEILPLRLSKTQLNQMNTTEERRDDVMAEEVVPSGRVSLEVNKDDLSKRSESPSALDQTVTIEVSRDHQLPTQDSTSINGHSHSCQENRTDNQDDQEGNTGAVLHETINAQDEEIQEQIALPEQSQFSPKASSVHSSSSDMYVDADAGEGVPRSTTAESGKSFLNIYHPEMRLSHEVDERSVRRTVLANSTPPFVPRPRKQTEKAAQELLFFDNDEEEDDNDANEVLAVVQAGPSRLPDSAPANENKAQADSVDMDFTMAEEAMPASPPHDESQAVPQSSSTSMGKTVQKLSKPTHATKAPKLEKGKGKLTSKAEGKKKARDVGEDREKARKPIRRRLDEDGESQSDDDLTQSLNVDNFVKSTSTKEKELKRRRNLLRLQQRQARALKRRQGIDLPSSESSDSDSGSTSSSSSDDDDVESFVVSDTEVQQKTSKRKGMATCSNRSSAVKQRRLPSPPVLSESRLLAYVQSLDSRMRFREYVRWLVLYALDIETDDQDLKRLEAVRAKLRDDFTMLYRSLTTMSNRRQFTWYLTHFPQFERRPMSAEEKKKHVGCHACHRKSQRCEYAFTCWGALYHLSTLTKLSKSEHTSSAMSDDSEDHKLVSKNEKKEKVFTFFLGESCAIKSSVKHKLYHWERRALSDVTKLPAFKELRGKESEDVSTGEVEDIVNSYYMKLSRRFQVLKNHTGQLAMDNFSSYTKIRDRWDED